MGPSRRSSRLKGKTSGAASSTPTTATPASTAGVRKSTRKPKQPEPKTAASKRTPRKSIMNARAAAAAAATASSTPAPSGRKSARAAAAAAKASVSPPPKETKKPKASKETKETKALEVKKQADTSDEKFPSFNVHDEKGETIDSGTLENCVVFLYPKANTPGCTTQACGFRDNFDELNKLGYKVYGLSYDSPNSQNKWKTKHNMPYSLLCDKPAKSNLIKSIGCHKAPKSVIRSHFVIGANGIILEKHIKISPKNSIANAIEFCRKNPAAPTSAVPAEGTKTRKDDAEMDTEMVDAPTEDVDMKDADDKPKVADAASDSIPEKKEETKETKPNDRQEEAKTDEKKEVETGAKEESMADVQKDEPMVEDKKDEPMSEEKNAEPVAEEKKDESMAEDRKDESVVDEKNDESMADEKKDESETNLKKDESMADEPKPEAATEEMKETKEVEAMETSEEPKSGEKPKAAIEKETEKSAVESVEKADDKPVATEESVDKSTPSAVANASAEKANDKPAAIADKVLEDKALKPEAEGKPTEEEGKKSENKPEDEATALAAETIDKKDVVIEEKTVVSAVVGEKQDAEAPRAEAVKVAASVEGETKVAVKPTENGGEAVKEDESTKETKEATAEVTQEPATGGKEVGNGETAAPVAAS